MGLRGPKPKSRDYIRPPVSHEILQRVEKKIKKDASGCWLWDGNLTPYGYVMLRIAGKMRYLHRVMWEITNETYLPPGNRIIQCHHACYQRHCVNPDHIEALTMLDHRHAHVGLTCRRGHDTSVPGKRDNKGYCLQCRDNYNRAHYLAHREERMAYQRAYHAANREEDNRKNRERYRQKKQAA